MSRRLVLVIAVLIVAVSCAVVIRNPPPNAREGHLPSKEEIHDDRSQPPLDVPPRWPFGLSMVTSVGDAPMKINAFVTDDVCGFCHERQYAETAGSMHVLAHTDRLYRTMAEMALREAGPEVYTFCAGCHTPQGVASGLVPTTHEAALPAEVTSGVMCDTCHQIGALTGDEGPWGEPGNASIVLDPDDDRKFGPSSGDDDAAVHTVETRDFLSRSEFCASCHTVIHPLNGIRLEHTYGEWLESPYATADIQCQDCHMRTVPEALQVAQEMKPLPIMGLSDPSGEPRPIARHFFVGGNNNAEKLGGSKQHAEMAVERLQSAATLELAVPEDVRVGELLEIAVTVRNVAAGHSLPTSLVELRRIWVDLQVLDDDGQTIYHSGWLDEEADLGEDVMRFGALAGDAAGEPTYKPWEVTHFIWKRVIHAKEAATDRFRVRIPAVTRGPLTIEARLFYRIAPQFVANAIMGDDHIELDTVEMASARAGLPVVD